MTNFDLSLGVFSFLKLAGVDTVVVCAGARNAPLVLALQNENFKIFNYFEERSASFFGLGLIKASRKPVAILTTSGTAVAELLPATIEAYYQGLPLILITADRPKHYRSSGSPQTIEQVGLFSIYVESVYDLDVTTEKFKFIWSQKKPIHLNIAFDEPLIDEKSTTSVQVDMEKPLITSHESEVDFMNSSSKIDRDIDYYEEIVNPLIILGEISEQHQASVIEMILQLKAPVYAESLSQIRNNLEIKDFLIYSSDVLVKQIFQLKLCTSIIRIGGIPTLRFWRDLEDMFKEIPVINYSDLPFTGLSRKSKLIDIKKLHFKYFPTKFSSENLKKIMSFDKKLQIEKEMLFRKYPLSEQNLTKELSLIVHKNPIYLGNSLPIRNWDCFAICDSQNIYANRGANGIDGQISTYLGWSESLPKSFCFIGDLTALYDLASLGIGPQLNHNQRHIIIMNNFGGQIFKRVFKNDKFINTHQTQFSHWAAMWGWNYIKISNAEDLTEIKESVIDNCVIEILPNLEQTQFFWNEWDELCQKH